MLSDFIYLITTSSVFWLGLMLFLGLMVGSFHTVVVSRLPSMMFADWREQASEILNVKHSPEKVGNLVAPRSACPNCAGLVKWWMNVPVISYLILKGRCHYCATSISCRYPLIELLTATVTVGIAWVFGPSMHSVLLIAVMWLLIPAVLIDAQHKILPDSLVLTALWVALLGFSVNPMVDAAGAIYGAAFTYSLLYGVGRTYERFRGAIGLGEGDMKLFAVFGALAGLETALVMIPLAALIHIISVANPFRLREAQPFGPAILISGLILLVDEYSFGFFKSLFI